MSQHIHLQPVNEILKNLKPDTPPQWGRMTAQHMVEHLTNSVNASNGRRQLTSDLPQEKSEKAKVFLMSERAMPRGIGANPEAELPPLKHETLEKAIQDLQEAVQEFEAHHVNQQINYKHPSFGELNKQQWDVFHDKHFRHHFSQFGLLKQIIEIKKGLRYLRPFFISIIVSRSIQLLLFLIRYICGCMEPGNFSLQPVCIKLLKIHPTQNL